MFQSPRPISDFSQLAQLPLAKFSYTTTSLSHSGPLNWSHIIGNGDLASTFEKRNALGMSDRFILKVLRNMDILEEVDLTYFAQRIASSRLNQKPNFAVIVKLPCLAVKYPSGDSSLRRFQIKFSSDRDYYTALAVLSDTKCPFSESNISSMPLSRKPTPSSWNSGRETAVDNMPAPSSTILPLHSSSLTTQMKPSGSDSPAPSLAGQYGRSIDGSLPQLELTTPARSSSSTLSRPSTAATCYDTQTLSQILPPKRELPFSKPAAKKLRPSQASMASVATQPVRNDIQLSSPSPSPSIVSPTQIATKQGPNARKRSKICILPLPSRPATSATRTPKVASDASTMDTGQQEQEILPQPQPQLDSLASTLATYAATPTPERTSILQDWIAGAIGDDAFLQLCHDVESVWERIAFGKSR